MKKMEDEPRKGAPAYMNTYGDMMTLLLTFFVLLFSMSSVDAAKFKAFVASFDGGSGILQAGEVILADPGMLGTGVETFPAKGEDGKSKGEEATKAVKKELEEFIYQEKLNEKVGVEQRGDELILRFDDMLLFESGKADIKAGAVPILSILGEKLKTYLKEGYHLSIEGHTDNVPISTMQFPSNWELSAGRAIAVAKFLINEMDFDPSVISTEGFGEHEPIADNNTKEGRAQNRRVEIKLKKDSTQDYRKGGE